MDVLVTGGTGFVGTGVCEALHAEDHTVTALARSPTDHSLPEAVDVVEGDVRNPDSIDAAFEDQDAVVHLVALSPLRIPRGGEKRHDAVTRRGTRNVIRKAETHDLDHITFLSGIGADPNADTHYLRAKGQAENAIRDADIDWTIFRPSVIFGDGAEIISFTRRLTPPVIGPLPGGGHTPFQLIYRGDIAPMIVEATTTDDHAGETYTIGGPEVLTLAEIAKLIRRSRGQSTTIVPIPMGLAKLGMTIGAKLPGFPFGPDQYRGLEQDHTVDDNDIDAFGVTTDELTTFAEYLGVDTTESAAVDASHP